MYLFKNRTKKLLPVPYIFKIMLKKILLSVCLSCCLLSVYGQSSVTDSLYKTKTPARQPLLLIKWAPLSLVDQDNTVQFGVEYLFKGPVSLQQEIGYGWFNFTDNNDNGPFKNREVWRSRTELRFYAATNGQLRKPKGPYLAMEFLYKRINYNKQGNVGRECNGFECEYFEKMDYKILKDVYGYHGKIGWQFLIENRLAIDLYIGGGLRGINVKSPGLPADENNFGEDTGFGIARPTEPGSYTLISMCGGFKFGYLIYRSK